jgi:hypothetical protein
MEDSPKTQRFERTLRIFKHERKNEKGNGGILYCDVLAVGNRATVECDVNNMADVT